MAKNGSPPALGLAASFVATQIPVYSCSFSCRHHGPYFCWRWFMGYPLQGATGRRKALLSWKVSFLRTPKMKGRCGSCLARWRRVKFLLRASGCGAISVEFGEDMPKKSKTPKTLLNCPHSSPHTLPQTPRRSTSIFFQSAPKRLQLPHMTLETCYLLPCDRSKTMFRTSLSWQASRMSGGSFLHFQRLNRNQS